MKTSTRTSRRFLSEERVGGNRPGVYPGIYDLGGCRWGVRVVQFSRTDPAGKRRVLHDEKWILDGYTLHEAGLFRARRLGQVRGELAAGTLHEPDAILDTDGAVIATGPLLVEAGPEGPSPALEAMNALEPHDPTPDPVEELLAAANGDDPRDVLKAAGFAILDFTETATGIKFEVFWGK